MNARFENFLITLVGKSQVNKKSLLLLCWGNDLDFRVLLVMDNIVTTKIKKKWNSQTTNL